MTAHSLAPEWVEHENLADRGFWLLAVKVTCDFCGRTISFYPSEVVPGDDPLAGWARLRHANRHECADCVQRPYGDGGEQEKRDT